MSIFDELLILIDDQTEIRTSRIEELLPQFSRQAIGSTLGRLVSRGWLQRTSPPGGQEEAYRITNPGNEYISNILAAIRRGEQPWTSQWFCVVVTLPETQRKERDVLRHYLLNRGFGRLVDGFYISPWNRREEVIEVIRRLGIGSAVFMFETQALGQATTQIVINQAWNWDEMQRRVAAFLADAKPRLEEIESKAKLSDTKTQMMVRHLAKGLVFDYGLLLSADPNLALSVNPAPTDYQKAREIYERVREFCYR